MEREETQQQFHAVVMLLAAVFVFCCHLPGLSTCIAIVSVNIENIHKHQTAIQGPDQIVDYPDADFSMERPLLQSKSWG